MKFRVMVFAMFLLIAFCQEKSFCEVKEYIPMPYSFELIKEAQSGNADAQCILGLAYADGNGVQQDKRAAFTFYKKAAEQGNPWAQNKVGFYYAKGIGVEKNEEEAKSWYKKASDQGYEKAKIKLNELNNQKPIALQNADKHPQTIFKYTDFYEKNTYRLNINDPELNIYSYDSICGQVIKKEKEFIVFLITSINFGVEPDKGLPLRNSNVNERGSAVGKVHGQNDVSCNAQRCKKEYINKTITIDYWKISDKAAL